MNFLDNKLKSDRLILRKLSLDDAADMLEYTSNPEVSTHLSWNAHTNIKQTEAYIKTILNEYNYDKSYTWAIEIIESRKFIGIVRLFEISYGNRRGELSYILNPDYHGKGYAIEAIRAVIDYSFNNNVLNRIQARCTTNNISSERVMQKLGMNYEGLLKEFWIYKGIPCDAKLYGLTLKDYSSGIK